MAICWYFNTGTCVTLDITDESFATLKSKKTNVFH